MRASAVVWLTEADVREGGMRTHPDAIIIGGSFAGLSAAMYLARARRSVWIIDTGLPRNRFSDYSHGFFTHDGSAPGDMLAIARAQVDAYPTTTFVDAEAISAAREQDGLSVRLGTGDVLRSTALVLAFGISDELPNVPGIAERWGKSVLHCPYCHGYEFSGRRLGVLHVSPMSIHQAMLIAEWGETTLYLNGAPAPDDATLAQLHERGISIEPAPISALQGRGVSLSALDLADGRTADVDALYLSPRFHLNSEIGQQLGCETDESPLGRIIRTDGTKLTTVPQVYAAGDITRAAHNVTWASADGVMAGMAVHRALVF
jgi:thioredoxin reductase